MKRGRKLGKPTTFESWMMANGKQGQSFYSTKIDRHLTAIACNYRRKIKTLRLVTVTTGKEEPTCRSITKVTLVSKPFGNLKKNAKKKFTQII